MKSTGKLCALCLLAYGLAGASAQAEIYLKSYPSPDKTYVVRVYWLSEAPDSAVTLLEGGKTLWSFHPDPEDKPVRAFWRPSSDAFLMEHVTKHGEYRLYIVNIREDHVRMFPITVDPKADLSSIVDGSIAWDQVDAGLGVIFLSIRGRDSTENKMRIVAWRWLQPKKGPRLDR